MIQPDHFRVILVLVHHGGCDTRVMWEESGRPNMMSHHDQLLYEPPSKKAKTGKIKLNQNERVLQFLMAYLQGAMVN